MDGWNDKWINEIKEWMDGWIKVVSRYSQFYFIFIVI